MGLDYTEILMACEEEFGIEIDDDISSVETVGELYEYILVRLGLSREPSCLAMPGFLRLRRRLAAWANVPTASITLESSLRALGGGSGKAQLLHRLCESKIDKCSWKSLMRNLRDAIIGSSIISAYWMILVGGASHILINWFLCPESVTTFVAFWVAVVGVVGFWAYLVGTTLVTWSRRRRALNRCDTVRDLLGFLLDHKFSRGDSSGKRWSSATLWNRLVEIVSERLGVDEEAVTPDAHLSKDLGAW